jgi:hypothetical protein
MSQPSTAAATASGHRICLVDPPGVRSWCAELRCTEHELREAVYAVGSEPGRIRRYFLHLDIVSRL